MKAAYCEIKRGRNCVTVNYYSKEGYGLELGCRKLERERREAYAAKRRRLNRIRENIGAGVGMLGFLLLLCAGGTEEISVIVMTGAAGLVLMVLGGWLGHAFYGQEENAEWLRRMRERGEVEWPRNERPSTGGQSKESGKTAGTQKAGPVSPILSTVPWWCRTAPTSRP